jgi:predicted PurR-regulated permease PerM
LLPRRAEHTVVKLAEECNDVLGAFVKGQLLVMMLLGAVYAVGLQLVGVRVGLIIGLVAGIASIIPYLGFAVGLIAAVIATLFQFGMNWMQISLVGLVFFIGQMIEGYVLQPFLLGDKIGLSPVAVIFAIMAGAQLFGFVGMLLALPVAAVLVVLLRYAHQSYQDSGFYQVVQVVDVPTHALTEEQVMGTETITRGEPVDRP